MMDIIMMISIMTVIGQDTGPGSCGLAKAWPISTTVN